MVDSKVTGRSEALTQLGGFEKNLEAYLADCKTRITCTLARAGDPREKLVAMMDSLDKAPLPVGNRQLTRSLAMMAVLATMYNQLRWKGLDDALTTLVGGGRRYQIPTTIYQLPPIRPDRCRISDPAREAVCHCHRSRPSARSRGARVWRFRAER